MAQTQRLHYLDSVRGIAALLVVFYHFIGWHWGEELSFHLASMFFNGSDAVSFFFVLSGFVLSYKYFHSDRPLDIKKYTFNRFLRLYPAFMFAVLLNYLYWYRHEVDVWIFLKNVLWKNEGQIWEELAMVRNHHKFYVPGWTLGVEMALSILMPVLIIAGKKSIQLITWLIPLSIFMGPGYVSPFLSHFLLGMLLSYYYKDIKEYDFTKSRWYTYRYGLYLGIFALFSLRHIERIHAFPQLYYYWANLFKIDIFHYTGFASFLILLCIINNEKIQAVLHRSSLVFLGKISYSVYLVHWLIIVIIMERWERLVAFFGNSTLCFVTMLTFAVVSTLIMATFTYYFIEEPFIKLSKRVSSRFS